MLYKALLAEVEAEIGSVSVIKHEDSKLIGTIHSVLKFLTRKESFSGFTTTILKTMYVPNNWDEWRDEDRYKLLRHERVHLRQFRNWPFKFLGKPGLWYINAKLFSICYLLIAPAFFTMRAKFEKAGYRETIKASIELGRVDVTSSTHRKYWIAKMENTFSTGMYFWMARKGYGKQLVDEVFDAELARLNG